MTRPVPLIVLAVLLVLAAACGAEASREPSPTPGSIPDQAVPGVDNASPVPSQTQLPSLVTTPTPTPQKVEPHIPIPTPSPSPQPGETPTPGPSAPGATTDAEDEVLQELRKELLRISTQVADMRGLALTEEPPIGFLTGQEMAERVQQDIIEEYTPEEAALDREFYLILDFVEEDIDLIQVISDLYAGAVIGFYDTDVKELFILSDKEELGPDEKVTFAHELTHVLQDQGFDLDAFLPEEEENGDLELAKLALVEGDATWAMLRYATSNLSQGELQSLGQSSDGQGGISSAPRILQEQLRFPYDTGLAFVAHIFRTGGWEAVDRAYRQPPKSTEQVMHPERYTSGDEPVEVALPALAGSLGEDWETLDTGVLGEFILKTYLSNYLSFGQATGAALGWGGDTYSLMKNGSTGESIMVSLSAWDTVGDAQEFFDAYVRYIDKKGEGSWGLKISADAERWWEAQGHSVYLSIREQRVLLIIGEESDSLDHILQSLPDF
ncbi:MAG: hypothetical protein V3U79_01625 [Dehalococcoidia bacterium]